MTIWEIVKDVSVDSRRRDEEFHVRAMSEIQSGKRRDGLWAQAIIASANDEATAKIAYFKLLVQALKDDDYINMRSLQAQSKIAQEPPLKASSSTQKPVKKPSLMTVIWYWFVIASFTLILISLAIIYIVADFKLFWWLAFVCFCIICYALEGLKS